MKFRKLGNSNLMVSEIALGCWGFAGDEMWGAAQDEESIATIYAAMDAGINFMDTAEGYGNGHSEKVLGSALRGLRHKVVIATKVSPENLTPTGIRKSCENSLRRLQTSYIDLYQIHWPNRKIPHADTVEALQRLKETGKILEIGVSNYGIGDLTNILSYGKFCSNQLPYNLLARAIEYEILPECIQEGISILCYSPLLHGILAGKYQSADDVPVERARTRHFSKGRPLTRHRGDGHEAETFRAIEKITKVADQLNQPLASIAVSWLLHQPGIASVITGARHPQQIQKMAASHAIQLDQPTLTALNEITEPLKVNMGSNPDLWQSGENSRYY